MVLSKSYEYKIKSGIKKKINKLVSFELPLLIESGLIDQQMIERLFSSTNIDDNMFPLLGKTQVNSTKPICYCIYLQCQKFD